MTLAELVSKASVSEEIEIELDGVMITGRYIKDEILSGQIPDIGNADEVQVIAWFSLADDNHYSTYTFVRCKKVVDLDDEVRY